MNRRYLIINADDFGMNSAMNAAIDNLFCQNAITSSTLLSPASHAADACRMAAEKGYPVGVHWTLHSEWEDDLWPALSGLNSLSDGNAMLPGDGKRMARSAKGADVTRELTAQYQFMVSNGCTPDHADSHGGTLYGLNGRLFFINAFKVCKKYGLPFRFPKTDGFLRRQLGGEVPVAIKAAHRAVVLLAQAMGVRLIDNFVTHPDPVKKIDGYADLCGYYEKELAAAPAGFTEVFLHPALKDAAMAARTAQWQKREWEYRYLSEGRLIDFARREGFEPVSWGALKEKRL